MELRYVHEKKYRHGPLIASMMLAYVFVCAMCFIVCKKHGIERIDDILIIFILTGVVDFVLFLIRFFYNCVQRSRGSRLKEHGAVLKAYVSDAYIIKDRMKKTGQLSVVTKNGRFRIMDIKCNKAFEKLKTLVEEKGPQGKVAMDVSALGYSVLGDLSSLQIDGEPYVYKKEKEIDKNNQQSE